MTEEVLVISLPADPEQQQIEFDIVMVEGWCLRSVDRGIAYLTRPAEVTTIPAAASVRTN
jgi:hypothetical protein